jgi:hypothetical protein
MKRSSTISVISIIAAALAAAPLFGADAVIKKTEGKVELKEQGGNWQPAEAGMTLSRGTFISTGFGSEAVLELGGSTLEVRELTRMQLERLVEEKEALSTDLFLEVGKVKAEVQSSEGLRNDFEVRSPVSTAAVRGTTFIFDGYTLRVEEGTVVYSNVIGQSRQVAGGLMSRTQGYTPPADQQETVIDGQFEVETSLSGNGGTVLRSTAEETTVPLISEQTGEEEQATAILNFTWD